MKLFHFCSCYNVGNQHAKYYRNPCVGRFGTPPLFLFCEKKYIHIVYFKSFHSDLSPLMRQSQQKLSAFSSVEMFNKPLWQKVWTQIRLLLQEQSDLGPPCLLLYLNCIMLDNYLQQRTSADIIFQMHF